MNVEHNEPTKQERETQRAAILFLWLSQHQKFKLLSAWSWIYTVAKDRYASDSRMIPKLKSIMKNMDPGKMEKACKVNKDLAKWCAEHHIGATAKAEITLKQTRVKVDQSQRRPNENYEYMPASIDSLLKGYSIGIRYERNAEFTFTRKGEGYIVRTRDRTLYFSRSFGYSKNRLTAIDLDEVIDGDLFANKELLGKMGYNFAMVNAQALTKKYGHVDYDGEKTKWWPTIVADSGGFQLSIGTESFLDPVDIAEKHNLICDVGIALDIPLGPSLQKAFLARSAKVQKLNNDVLMSRKRPSLEILNVTHGHTFYLRNKFREVVERDDIDRLALGGIKKLEILPLVLTILHGMTTGRKYKHYHALGISGLSKWTALAYIGAKNLGATLTSDSSSFLQTGLRCQFDMPHPLAKNMDFRGQYRNVHAMLPCSCNYCSAARYSEVMLSQSSTMSSSICVFHNLIVYKRYVEEITELAKGTKAEIISYLRPNFNPEKLKQINLALTAIDMAVQESPEKAAKRFYPSLLEKFPQEGARGLFSDAGMSKIRKSEYERLDKVLSSYELYHKEQRGSK